MARSGGARSGIGLERGLVRRVAVLGLVLTMGLPFAAPASAQNDWFRPPVDIGQSGARNAQPSRIQRQQARPQPQQARPQRQQAVRQQARPRQPEPKRVWTPFQPLLDLFNPDPPPRRADSPSRVPSEPTQVARPPVIAAPAEVRGAVYETAAAAREAAEEPIESIVLVIGDENSAALAQGLADIFASDRKKVAVVGRSEPGSGLAPGSKFDWVRGGSELAQSQDASVVVLLAGANDLAPIDDPSGRAELFDERWREIYGRRIDDFLLGVKLRGRPAVIVGLPPVDDTAAAERHAQFNMLLKERVERAGFVFVEVWDGFVDENGKFLMSGPDVDGQRRRLRSPDGIGFTRAGGKKLAFFVDKQLDDLLSREVALPGMTVPERPSIVVLSGGAAAGARSLAGGPVPVVVTPEPAEPTAPDGAAPDPAKVLTSGEPLPAVLGRVDDFRWPAGQPTALMPEPASLTEGAAPAAVPASAPAAGTASGNTPAAGGAPASADARPEPAEPFFMAPMPTTGVGTRTP
ncbi:DUF459 domain-containing protein [Ancylobacter sp. A5.8]|uniref:SGNH/GDSL hydrolase family protein n=1 Tax=Ancylobacter gelatini TaxID=2919920 RepID=UPI001F4DF66B|nr:DUF459 domain-containing protein [Ancylobacter gelatini]MCJ8144943.1 DUF459 domain-containing protein [Ancylobacter gelatini]